MKRLISRIIIIASAVLALPALVAGYIYGTAAAYEVYFHSGTGIVPEEEHDIEAGEFWDDSAPQSETIRLFGRDITGTYEISMRGDTSKRVKRMYKSEDGDLFTLDQNGRCVYFNLNYHEKDPEQLYTTEECAELARKFLADFVDDIDMEEYVMETKPRTNECYFTFTRFIGGFKTRDSVWVNVWCNGQIDLLNSSRPCEEKNTWMIPFNKLSLNIAIENKINEVYENSWMKNPRIEDLKTDMEYLTLANGEACIISQSEFKLISDDRKEPREGKMVLVILRSDAQKAIQLVIFIAACLAFVAGTVCTVVIIRKKWRNRKENTQNEKTESMD